MLSVSTSGELTVIRTFGSLLPSEQLALKVRATALGMRYSASHRGWVSSGLLAGTALRALRLAGLSAKLYR